MIETPLHIFLTDPHLAGGGQVRYITNLARELLRAGHRVTIGCRPGSVLIPKARELGAEVAGRFSFRGGLRLLSWAGDLRALRRFIQSGRPDIVHANLSQDHWACAAANRSLGGPACLVRTRHNTYPVRDSLPNRVLNRRWTDYQIVVCDVVRQALAAQPTFDAERLCSIHNGVDARAFAFDPRTRARARDEFGLRDDDLVLGIAARLVEDKGHRFLFEAAAQAVHNLPTLRILVLGQGVLEAPLKQLVERLGLGPHVRFLGFREDMAYCVQAFDIGVQPSIGCDTSSLALKEQMAAQRPVIASDYGGLREIVTDGLEGIVVPAGTVGPLARAIETLGRDPRLRRNMGEAGRQRVLRDFTVEVFAQRTIEAYRRALELHQRARANGHARP